jgi:phospholipase C
MSARRNLPLKTIALVSLLGAMALPAEGRTAGIGLAAPATPIEHVVFLFMENHSFDNVLGHLCVAEDRCNGSTTAKLSTGETIPLVPADDLIPQVPHGRRTQAPRSTSEG